MQVEPIDRVANICVESEADLVNDYVYSFFHGHSLWYILASIVNLQSNFFIAKILTEADMNNVARQNLTELSRHVYIVPLFFAFVDVLGPLNKGVCCFIFKCFKHVDEAVFIEGVSTGLPLSLPIIIVVSKYKRLANYLLEHN